MKLSARESMSMKGCQDSIRTPRSTDHPLHGRPDRDKLFKDLQPTAPPCETKQRAMVIHFAETRSPSAATIS
jgi:hypothetical protein